MKFHLETAEQHLISHYGPGSISVDGKPYSQNILITSKTIVENWFDGDISSLAFEHFEHLFSLPKEDKPDIVLLGTGTDHIFPNIKLLAELNAEGLSLEVMNTRAACRTYSVLIGEQRAVAAALLQIEH